MDRRFFLGTIATIPLHIALNQDELPGLAQPTKVKLVLDYTKLSEPFELPNGEIGYRQRAMLYGDVVGLEDGLIDKVDGAYHYCYMDANRAWLMSDGTMLVERYVMRHVKQCEPRTVRWNAATNGPATYTSILENWKLAYLDGSGNTIYVLTSK